VSVPKNLQADIEWHRLRIAFYEQALEALGAVIDGADTKLRQEEIRTIIADLRRTLNDLEHTLGRMG
jgi:hypothetical protein